MAEQKSSYFGSLLWIIFAFFLIKYIFLDKPARPDSKPLLDQSGQMFKVPESPMEREPLKKTYAILEDNGPEICVDTNFAQYTLSAKNAALSGIKYLDIKNKNGEGVNSLTQNKDFLINSMGLILNSEKGVCCPEFVLRSREEFDDQITLVFESLFLGWKILKTLVFQKNSYEILMGIDFQQNLPENVLSTLKPRVIFNAPSEKFGGEPYGLINSLSLGSADRIYPENQTSAAWKMPYLFGMSDRFFVHSFIGEKSHFAVKRAYFDYQLNRCLVGFLELWPVTENSSLDLKFYFGPKKIDTLSASAPELKTIISSSFLAPVYKFFISLLEWLFKFVQNYGIAIFLLALLLKLLLLPLTIWSKKKLSVFAKFEADHAQELADLNRKYSDSLVVKGEQISKFYASYGLSQSSRLIAAIVPLVVQVFVVFCLYRALVDYVAFFNAPFALWITDLSSHDPYFVLPLALGLFSIAQQHFSQQYMGNQSQGSFFTKYLSVLIVPVLFIKAPAGAVLFWLSNSFLMVCEDLILKFLMLGRR